MGQTASYNTPSRTSSSGCPIDPKILEAQQKCPVDHQSPSTPAQCPVEHSSSSSINPLNQIPTDLANNASSHLPTEREMSTIPRNSEGGTWEYPSPQQFHTALARKGMETPEEHVEMMVAIHNWLNEAAWNEVLKWEHRANPDDNKVQLARLRGRPGELSPKARFFMLAGWLLPSRFNTEPPFDRHDWIIRRPRTNEEVRYVIDYYSAPPEPDGSPAFSLDVRPALDSFGSIKARISVATEETWSQFRRSNTSKSS